MFSVHGAALGLYLYRNKNRTVQYSIETDTDSDDVKHVKGLIKLMVAQHSTARPSIQEVVDTLTYLLNALRAKIQRDNPPALLARK